MGRIVNDRFLSREGWWSEVNSQFMSEAPVVANGYVRHRLPVGGGGVAGSHHFAGNDGWMDRQIVVGDFDVVADVQLLNFDETDLPGTATPAAPFAYGVACHNVATPELYGTSGYTRRDYFHKIISSPVSGGTSTARMVSEYKRTIDAASVWDTVDGQETQTAADLGGDFDELGGRWWLRLRRVGQVFTSWDAPLRTDGRIPLDDAWTNEYEFTLTEMRELTYVGLVAYSSSATASFTGRCRAFINYNGG